MKKIVAALIIVLTSSLIHASVVHAGQSPPPGERTWFLAEGSTGTFFDTLILIANPNDTPTPVTITFFKPDGTTVVENRTLPATSRTTIDVETIPGLEATDVSTMVASPSGAEVVVERTMRWDASGYGSHTEKATSGAHNDWYFAEGSQGFFLTYFLLSNPQPTANVAHVTFLREGRPPISRNYDLAPSSRRTIFAGDEPELADTAFGARIQFDQPGAAERAMYFGRDPLWIGGHESIGVNAPSTRWFLAEGATGVFFRTYVLLANPGSENATATLRFLPATTAPVTRRVDVPAGGRVTLDIAVQDPLLADAAMATEVESDRPLVVERAQYWPNNPGWYEAHNSFGVTETGTRWGLAEGFVGGPRAEQTYILLANPGAVESIVGIRFLRENGSVVSKQFTVAPNSRFNVAVIGPGSDVPELANEAFGAVIDATEPIAVERSLYSDIGGAIWAAGSNATATRLAPEPPPTSPVVTVELTDTAATELAGDTGTITLRRAGGNLAQPLVVTFTMSGTATYGVDYPSLNTRVTFPANQASLPVVIGPFRDNDAENNETAELTIQPGAGYEVGTNRSGTVTITDDPPVISLAISRTRSTEQAQEPVVFTLSRTGGLLADPVIVNLSTRGSATYGADYNALLLRVTIPANQATATVTVTPLKDNFAEPLETMELRVAQGNYETTGPTSRSFDIEDEIVFVAVEATDDQATEAGPDTGSFRFTRAGGNLAEPLSIGINVTGSALAGADFTTFSLTVTIPANQTTAMVTVTPVADGAAEPEETVIVTIIDNDQITVTPPGNATVRIRDM
jgi:hypothetical protein